VALLARNAQARETLRRVLYRAHFRSAVDPFGSRLLFASDIGLRAFEAPSANAGLMLSGVLTAAIPAAFISALWREMHRSSSLWRERLARGLTASF